MEYPCPNGCGDLQVSFIREDVVNGYAVNALRLDCDECGYVGHALELVVDLPADTATDCDADGQVGHVELAADSATDCGK